MSPGLAVAWVVGRGRIAAAAGSPAVAWIARRSNRRESLRLEHTLFERTEIPLLGTRRDPTRRAGIAFSAGRPVQRPAWRGPRGVAWLRTALGSLAAAGSPGVPTGGNRCG